MTEIAHGTDTPASVAATILCVDDEPDILSALRRLFHGAGYAVRVATGGMAALHTLEDEPVDLVIADMQMPEMNGNQLLYQVRERWPQTVRFMLTGRSDIGTVIDAINQGEIARYVTKPWDNKALLQAVGDALQRKRQENDKVYLATVARRRAEEVKALDNALQETASPGQGDLTHANERIRNNFVVSLKVFASLIEVRRAHLAGHARRVADLGRKMAIKLNLEPALGQEVFVAGLLHELGKLGFSDELLNTPVAGMNPRQLQEYRLHASRAEQLLMPLQDLRGAAACIGAQLERFDGAGFPNQIRGRAILVGARILAVCADYDNLQIGVLAPRKLPPGQASAVIEASSGKRYDAWVVEAFVAILDGDMSISDPPGKRILNELVVSAKDLAIGMVLTRDLISPSGLLMLSAKHELNSHLIQKMRDFEKSTGVTLTMYVQG